VDFSLNVLSIRLTSLAVFGDLGARWIVKKMNWIKEVSILFHKMKIKSQNNPMTITSKRDVENS
jgi:hypothetical protein